MRKIKKKFEKKLLAVAYYFIDKINTFVPTDLRNEDCLEELQLVKKIAKMYVNIRSRAFVANDTLSQDRTRSSVRSKFTKLIIFSHV